MPFKYPHIVYLRLCGG